MADEDKNEAIKKIDTIIRQIRPEEYGLLQEFLYQAIYIPEGTKPPPRSVVDLPELQVYVAGFGTQPGDYCLVAEIAGTVVGAAWSRIMQDYGHIDDRTPSLAISLLPEYRGLGIGAQLLRSLLLLLQENGYLRLSLSVQKDNPALRLYERAGFRILAGKGTEYLMLRDITQSVQQENADMETTIEKQRENKIQQWFSMWLDRKDTGIEYGHPYGKGPCHRKSRKLACDAERALRPASGRNCPATGCGRCPAIRRLEL